MANPLATLASWFLPQPEDFQTRSVDFPSFEQQMAAIWARQKQPRPWRSSSINEALGVPAIFSAVSLISNTVGTLSLEGFQLGQLLTDRAQIPRLIVRPNPFSTPRDFFRDTAFYLATRGEAWWWIAARDVDDAPMSLYPVPPWEITVAQNDRNRLRPVITWLNREMRNEDMRHITYLPSHDGLRGVGPLQMCGAAASVTVEAQEWAANFFAGSTPSIIGETDMDLSPEDMTKLDDQWNEKPSNLPRWVDNGLKVKDFTLDPSKAQLTESRQHQVGEVARMFSMPGALIEYQMSGSSLTYQNQSDIWNDFQRRCLSPHYLEPIEQEISDLLTRATVARFNTNQLLRADVKTRFEVYESGVVKSGVLTVEEARKMEGLDPGAVDFAPVPLSPPQAVPNVLPFQQRSLKDAHCPKCGKLVGRHDGAFETKCQRCGTLVAA
jgi:HK97 family phage portal protein